MTKKNQEKKVVKEVKEILDNVVVTTEDSLLDESLAIDMEKLSKDLEVMKQEIFEEKKVEKQEEPKKVEKQEEPKKVKEELKEKENKKLTSRRIGLIWNGQQFDY